ncbi:MAG TPA: hypothetical protein DDY31_06130 [Lachnospiraceae bacterium]|nr:hypothetical protein [Lachnospiraceae bacterium]
MRNVSGMVVTDGNYMYYAVLSEMDGVSKRTSVMYKYTIATGKAFVISSEAMEAILSGNESFTDYEILEEFSVYDYYDIEPAMNPKSDIKHMNSKK